MSHNILFTLWKVFMAHKCSCPRNKADQEIYVYIHTVKNGLKRVHNWVSQSYTLKRYIASSYVVSLTIAIHILCFVYTVILHVPLWLQVCCTVSGQSYPTKEYHSQGCGHSFYKIMYLYIQHLSSIDATITKQMQYLQELHTLLNPLNTVQQSSFADIGTLQHFMGSIFIQVNQ